ncbi:MAG: DNA polymerase III subunit alpha, partial [Phycisphaerales bacterium]|nr:DNA polymerase III subunit alpha [Phycisphaerales bacterium]
KGGGRIDIERIDYTALHVYQTVFQKGNTKGVFQFESGGMKDLLVKMKPDRLEDLIAANALYRPGPMDLIPDYCARKHRKQEVPSLHPLADDVLAETYGVMVYQEQVMRILNRLGDIPLRRAYDIIKAISKKNAEIINKEKANFIQGATQKGLTEEQAKEIFANIEKFAGYGFNKSHSTRYSVVAYQTAWLKTYFPAQYMAALLTFEMINQSKTVEYIDECRYLTVLGKEGGAKTGIDILPPDLNESDADFRVVNGNIRFGLAAVKGVGQKAVESIMLNRKTGGGRPYKSIYDFCERVDLRVVNKGVIEALIKCGAFDAIHPVRAASMAAAEAAARMGQQSQEAKLAGQESLFGGFGGGAATVEQVEPKLPSVPEWPQSEKMAAEKAVLGFYVSSHPLRDVEQTFQSYITLDTQTIRNASDKSQGFMGGLISKIRPMTTKSGPNAGSRWVILLIEDLVGQIEVVLYSNEYQKFQELIKADALLFFEGSVDKMREEPSFKAREVFTLDSVQKKKTREVLIQTSSMKLDDATLDAVKKTLDTHKGGTPVKIELADLTVTPPVRVQLQLGTNLNIQNGGVAALQKIFGDPQVIQLGPNRRMKREPIAMPEEPRYDPSDEFYESEFTL